MTRAGCALWGLLCAVLIGCGADFDPGSRVNELRLLGMQADRPFARPGERVSLQLLLLDPEARGESLSLGFSTCTDPSASTLDACLATLDGPFEPSEASVAADASAEASFAFDVAEDALSRLSEQARPSALVGAVVVACPGTIEDGETAGVPVRCRTENGALLPITDFEVGVKRVFVRESDRNDNPEITALRWDGEDWPEGEARNAQACENTDTHDLEDCPKRLRHEIAIETSAGESGTSEFGEPFAEQMVVQAYATDGTFDSDVRIAGDATFQWVGQRAEGRDAVTMVFVVRDDRGGMSWVTRDVELE